MLYYVRFKAVKRGVSKVVIYLLWVCAVCLIVAIATCFIPAIHFLQRYAVIGIVLGLIVPNFFPKYKEIGECVLSDSEIIISRGEDIRRYPISDVADIKFFYLGYDGKRSGKTFLDGSFNDIAFRYGEEEITTSIMVLPEHISATNALFRMWKDNNIAYEVTDGTQRGGMKKFLEES